MPTEIAIRIPRRNGDVIATVRLERMERREGFTERDPWACDQGDPQACEIIPYPELPPSLFSYSWLGRGDGYDLRFTMHRGYAGGVLDGPAGRFDLAWSQLKELKLEYFRFEGDVEDIGEAAPTPPKTARPVPVLSATAAQAATLARIEPKSVTTGPQLDMLVLITEEVRRLSRITSAPTRPRRPVATSARPFPSGATTSTPCSARPRSIPSPTNSAMCSAPTTMPPIPPFR